MFDGFCGLGGMSVGFRRQGFDCIGLDIVDVGYPYSLILEDARDFDGKEWLGKVDYAHFSPPCQDFSQLSKSSMVIKLRGPPNPERGMILVRHAKRIIDEMEPRYWSIENVAGARKHFYPLLGWPIFKSGPWNMWGRFPSVMLPSSNPLQKTRLGKITASWLDDQNRFDPLASWKRARIPINLSEPLARAVKNAITVSPDKQGIKA